MKVNYVLLLIKKGETEDDGLILVFHTMSLQWGQKQNTIKRAISFLSNCALGLMGLQHKLCFKKRFLSVIITFRQKFGKAFNCQ